jgi:long-chain acyl-CoA synthetase
VRTTAEALATASTPETEGAPAVPLAEDDPVALIYTSGTSGAAKGVILKRGNLDFMLARTGERLDQLLRGLEGRERIFHYLPFCFAGSWILLLSCLLRGSHLTLSADLNRLPEEIRAARPHTMQNVPILLERMRAKVEQAIASKPAAIRGLYARAVRAHERIGAARAEPFDRTWRALAGAVLFGSVRRRIGPDLRALICGSASLAGDTQRFFQMLGFEVLQVYGLTETTAICTMDSPGAAHPDHVGRAIPGIEMRRAESGEILVRGPHVFGGYWRKPEETARAIRDGWFHTGDQGEELEDGCWKILGRTNHMIVLATGHNVSPEPIEERILSSIPDAKQVVVVGHRRKHLAALITGSVATEQIARTLERLNPGLAPYQRVHAFHVHPEPFTVESGMLTANGKLRREAILSRFDREIESLYSEAGR